MTKRIPYTEGSIFVLPVRNGGFARGVVTRMDGKGGVFGYFFGPKYKSIEEAKGETNLIHEHSIMKRMFGDLGLLERSWIIIGEIENWNRDEWPMPPLIRIDELCGKAWLSVYDEDTLDVVFEKQVDPSLKNMYPEDGLSGSGAVEVRLAKLLNNPEICNSSN